MENTPKILYVEDDETLRVITKHYLERKNYEIICAEVGEIAYKLFNKDASLLTKDYMIMESNITKKYFSKLYTHNDIQEEINYLNSSLIQMNSSNNNTHLCIEDVIDKIFAQRPVYVVSTKKSYCPAFLLDKYEFSQAGVLFKAKN